jgi:hypothetical protein
MKGHIVRLDQYTEFGKTDTVILALVINGTEARRILEDCGLVSDRQQQSTSYQQLHEALAAVEFGPVAIAQYNDRQGD